MKSFPGPGARPSPGDRNPSNKVPAYAATGVAPAVATSRATYTVPAGRKADVETILLQINRATAAGTPGLFQGYLQYTPSGGSAVTIASTQSITNTVGQGDEVNEAPSLTLLAGDNIQLWTVDASTTGTVNYTLSVVLTEYDA